MMPPDEVCASRGGLFRSIDDGNILGIFWVLFSVLSAFITAGTRFLVLGYCLNALPASPQPATAPCPRCQDIDDALLPHAPPSKSKQSSEELLAEIKRRMSHKPSIPRFAFCTALTIINVISMVLLAFSILALLYCSSELTDGTPVAQRRQSAFALSFWVIYACSALWASAGILCWAMLARNLWGGPEAAERWPIRSDIGAIIIFGVLMTPFVLIWLVAMGVWKGLRACLCRKPIKEVDEVEMERGIGFDSGDVSEEEDSDKK